MKTPIQTVLYFQVELSAYRDLVDLAERHWSEDMALYEESLESTDFELMLRFDFRRDLSVKLSMEYPQIQRKAFLVILLTKFEDFLVQLSDSIKESLPIRVEIGDLKGNGIERCKRYITKCTDYSFPADSPEWKNIIDYQKIRNVLVHADGHIDPHKHKDQLKIANQSEYLSTSSFARIHLFIEKEYLHQVISDMNSFAEKLFNSIKEAEPAASSNGENPPR